jgi:hypothetical protein
MTLVFVAAFMSGAIVGAVTLVVFACCTMSFMSAERESDADASAE